MTRYPGCIYNGKLNSIVYCLRKENLVMSGAQEPRQKDS